MTRGYRPTTKEDEDASKAGYYAFDHMKNSDDVNPYPKDSRERVMFSVGWAWAEDRWLDE